MTDANQEMTDANHEKSELKRVEINVDNEWRKDITEHFTREGHLKSNILGLAYKYNFVKKDAEPSDVIDATIKILTEVIDELLDERSVCDRYAFINRLVNDPEE